MKMDQKVGVKLPYAQNVTKGWFGVDYCVGAAF